jgi:hypothetical protein
MQYAFSLENTLEGLGVEERIILKWILENKVISVAAFE